MADPTVADVARQLGDTQTALNIVWTLLTGFLVMFMQAGFALVETGIARAKNLGHTMGMNFLVYSIGVIAYWVCGFAFQMGGVGPMFGQWNHFAAYAVEKLPYAIERYTDEVKRLHRVLNRRLDEAPYLAGDEYSIADIATFPWVRNPDRRGIDLVEYPSVKRWHDAIAARSAVQRGVAVLADRQRQGTISDIERENLFGKTQFAAR